MKAQQMFKDLNYEKNNPELFSERNGHVISWKLYGVSDDYRKATTLKRITFYIKEETYSISHICIDELGEDKYETIKMSSKEYEAINQQMNEIKLLNESE